ncbi:MAG: autotransporter-associated beta strand repeat-containing protein [Lentisphaeria bacterium]|nr:autotransporter-associated beta strand repeat-containing protein [Lentisphaeria bacterium]
MKTTSITRKLTTLFVVAFLFAAVSALAGTLTISGTTPTVDGGDIGNLIWTDTATFKFWTDTPNPGQSFTTGSAAGYKLNAYSTQASGSGTPASTRNYSLRVVGIDGANTTTLATDTFSTNTAWSAGDWFTWTLATPVLLSANTLYGVDVEHTSGGSWSNGIPYMRINSSNDIPNGFYYERTDGDPSTLSATTGRERIFHVDMDAIPAIAWDDGAATGIWNLADLNWGGGSAWSQNDGAVFGATGAGTVTLGADVSAFSVNFTANGYDIAQDGGGLYDLTVLNGGIIVGDGLSAKISAPLGGTSGLTKSGTGTLVLTGTNTYTGGTSVSAGTLQLGDGTTDGTLGGGDVSNSGVLSFNVAGSQTVGANITGAGSLAKAGAGTLTLTGTNDYSGGTTISAGKVLAGGDGHLGTGGVAIGATGELEYTGSATIPTLSGSGTLTLSSGTATVSSDNSAFSGATNASGTLVVNGALGGATTILSGGTLMGAGALSNVTVNAGTLAPGNSIDTITVGDLTLSGNYEWEVDATSNDLVVVTTALGNGVLDISGDVVIDITPLSGAYFSSSQVFTLFTYDGGLTTDGLASDLSVTYGGIGSKWLIQGATFADTGSAITLTGIEYIPEPSTIILAGLGLMGVTFRRRRR